LLEFCQRFRIFAGVAGILKAMADFFKSLAKFLPYVANFCPRRPIFLKSCLNFAIAG